MNTKIVTPPVSLNLEVLVFSIDDNKLKTVLVKRSNKLLKNACGIPWGTLGENESLENAAKRILKEKTGIQNVYLEQLYTFDNLESDSKQRIISVTYFALLSYLDVNLSAAPNRSHASWEDVKSLPQLAFDNKEIIEYAVKRIKSKLLYSNIANAFLPEKFRFYELQRVYEIILGENLDKRNFRKKMQSLNLIESTIFIDKSGSHRPAHLYRFKTRDLVLYD